MDALAGNSPSPRHEFFYFNDDGPLVALSYNQWKIVFAEQRAQVWRPGTSYSPISLRLLLAFF
jgi:hypothetical protein